MKRFGRALCWLGLHDLDGALGLIGACRRDGCAHITRSATLRGGGWIRMTEPPDPARRPSGPPPP
jgi:hypothetical protein